jgi:hypothetical protein
MGLDGSQMGAGSNTMKTLTADPNNILPVQFPEDTTNGVNGDDWSALSLEQQAQQLLNRCEKLKVDLTALSSAFNSLVVLNSDDDAGILSAVNAIAGHIANTTAAHDAAAIGISTTIPGLPGTDARAALVSARAQIATLEGIVNNGGTLETRVDDLETRGSYVRVQSHLLATLESYNYEAGMAGLGIIGPGGASAPITLGNTAAVGAGVTIWTALDVLPPGAKAVRVRAYAACRGANDGLKLLFAAPIDIVALLALTPNELRTYGVELPAVNNLLLVSAGGSIDIELPTGSIKKIQAGFFIQNGIATVLALEYTHWTFVLEGYWL